jgi:hypothetical protein
VYATVSDPQRFEQIQVELNALTRMHVQPGGAGREEQDVLLREIPAVRSALNDLITEKEKQRQIYEQLVGRYGQSELSKEMELQDKSETFRVIDPAILPTSPVSPNRVMIMLMGIIAGLGGAFGLLVLLGLLNSSVKSVDDVKALGLPIMALIPKVQRRAGDQAHEAQRIWGSTLSHGRILRGDSQLLGHGISRHRHCRPHGGRDADHAACIRGQGHRSELDPVMNH